MDTSTLNTADAVARTVQVGDATRKWGSAYKKHYVLQNGSVVATIHSLSQEVHNVWPGHGEVRPNCWPYCRTLKQAANAAIEHYGDVNADYEMREVTKAPTKSLNTAE